MDNLCKCTMLIADPGDRPIVGIVGTNPAEAWMSVSCECCVLSGRGFFIGTVESPREVRLSVKVKSR